MSLGLTTLITGQINKEAVINANETRLDNSVNRPADVSVAAGGTVVVSSSEKLDNGFLNTTGSPGSAVTLQIPDGDRRLVVHNGVGNSQTVTLTTATGSTLMPVLQPGENALIQIDGTEITVIGVIGDGTGAVAGAFGRTSEFIPAAAMQPAVTNGCSALAVVEGTAGQPNIHVRDFDQTTAEAAQFQFPFPNRWDGGTITFQVYDTHAGGQTGGLDGRVWGLSAVAISNDEAWDTAFGTQVTVAIDQANGNRVHTSSESSAVTVAGTPADADFIFFELERVTGDGADDMDQDARLLGVRIWWTADAGIDD